MDILIHGACGRMGRAVAALEGYEGSSVVARVDAALEEGSEPGAHASLEAVTERPDVVVDFSFHGATPRLVSWCAEHEVPVVVATTGHDEAERAAIEKAAEKTAVFFSANMSLGVALLANLARQAAAALPDAEVEIVEVHHDQKLDAPSGTALMLADAVKEARGDVPVVCGRSGHGKRAKEEIGISSLRLGNVVGVHEVHLSTGHETLVLKHEAADRALFAQGALAAAAFLAGRAPGLYTMDDLVEQRSA